MKKMFLMLLITLALPVIYNIKEVKAAASTVPGFTISGELKTAVPKDNKYEANYQLITPEGSKYYLKLTKDFYKEWVGKIAYFNVKGNYVSFAAYSSGLGKKANTAPKSLPVTGPGMITLGVISLIGAGIFQKKILFLKKTTNEKNH